jgi:pre-mRNA-splicing factor 38A
MLVASSLTLFCASAQIQPEKEIIVEFIKNEDFKYVRVLGAFYLRLVGRPVDIYQYLEPLYNDFRKVRKRVVMGWELTHIDEIIDILLRDEYFADVALPRLPKRAQLEEANMLAGMRQSALEADLDDDDDEDEDDAGTIQTDAHAYPLLLLCPLRVLS